MNPTNDTTYTTTTPAAPAAPDTSRANSPVARALLAINSAVEFLDGITDGAPDAPGYAKTAGIICERLANVILPLSESVKAGITEDQVFEWLAARDAELRAAFPDLQSPCVMIWRSSFNAAKCLHISHTTPGVVTAAQSSFASLIAHIRTRMKTPEQTAAEKRQQAAKLMAEAEALLRTNETEAGAMLDAGNAKAPDAHPHVVYSP